MLLLLASSRCPVDPIGAVNVRNRFEVKDLPQCRRLLDQSEKNLKETYNIVAMLPKEATPVKRGIETDIIVSIMYGVSPTQSTEIYRQTFTVLEFVKTAGQPLNASKQTPPESGKSHDPDATSARSVSTMSTSFRMERHDPYGWAALCKDYNPIHMSPTVARLFGFKGKIAHGNHVVAKAVESVLSESPAWIDDSKDIPGTLQFAMEVVFKRPITVPCELVATQITQRDKSAVEFNIALKGGTKPSVTVIWGN
ncbi:hypothetical protein K461DRAFT_298275 [Myriangium duriaei CBS 260.36]|uniref:MaoC-like domain-containing protein n=1 Tax=Myriangium duriaei CBS 260.36 TaxID=1168546 RepID=A0A9P4IVS7_9PEZI|nr:hypothetical protein K461DRAFT_298275 [Myriangium duriaei CBS 260.36]